MGISPSDGYRFTLSDFMQAVAGIAIACAISAWLGHHVNIAREAALDSAQAGRLSQIRLALFNYQEEYGTFPPVYTTDDHGRPLTSWRVLILPYFYKDTLYRAYDRSQPWDSPVNAPLISQIPMVYEMRGGNQSNVQGLTPFLAVTGTGTLWERPGQVHLQKETARKHEALAVINNHQMVPWTKPEDCSRTELKSLLASLNQPDGSIWVCTPLTCERAKPIHTQLYKQSQKPSSTSTSKPRE